MAEKEVGATIVIKRYQNRKLYDTTKSCYVTLEDIAQMVKDGDDVRVVDNRTGDDLTSVTLTQIIFEEEKRSKSLLPLASLKKIIRAGGEQIQEFVEKRMLGGESQITEWLEEAEKYVQGLIKKGDITREEGSKAIREALSTPQKGLNELQKRIEEIFREFSESVRGSNAAIDQLKDLEGKITSIEKKVDELTKRLKSGVKGGKK